VRAKIYAPMLPETTASDATYPAKWERSPESGHMACVDRTM